MAWKDSDREKAFTRLYEGSRDQLYHYLRKYTADTHLIEDLMQQCYLKVWQRIDAIRDIEKALPLVKVYARNLLIDTVRRRMKEDIKWLGAMEGIAEAVAEGTLPGEMRDRLRVLDIAIDRLPVACKQVYLYHREEGLSYKEISTRLSISVSMVEKHMSKAIRLLKAELLTRYPLMLLMIVAGERLL